MTLISVGLEVVLAEKKGESAAVCCLFRVSVWVFFRTWPVCSSHCTEARLGEARRH